MILIGMALLAGAWQTVIAAGGAVKVAPASTAMKRLVEGNRRFASQQMVGAKPTAARRNATGSSQHPYAVVIGCADSRVGPELVFDQNIGDLFVIRTAGNLVEDYALGSIEYAVHHLGVRLVVVLGHERCGAVGAAVSGGDVQGHIRDLVKAIRPSVKATEGASGDRLAKAVEANAARVAAQIEREGQFDGIEGLKVVRGYDDLDTGRVRYF